MNRLLLLFKVVLIICLADATAQGQVIISEFMASNTHTLLDEDGETSDWIEIFNLGQTNVNLNGWALTDSVSNPRKWRFPAVDLGSGKNLLVFASGKNRRIAGNPLHTSFKLSSTAGYLGLADPTGAIVFDYGSNYPEQAPDISFGVAWEETRSTLLATNAPMRFFVPQDDFLATGWLALEFPADTWQAAASPIGFGASPVAPEDSWLTAMTNVAPAIYYRFEGGGIIATNSGSLGATYNGTNIGGLSLSQVGERPPEAPGMPTNNLTPRFDGVNDYVNTAKGVLNDLTAFTISGWIKPAALSRARVGIWGQHDVIEFGFIDARTLQLSTANGGAVQADFPPPANQWRFVAVSGDGETLRIYIDGALVAEGGNATGNYGASAYALVIGGGGIFDASQNWFTGNIDEFSFAPRTLSADELFLLYQSAVAPGATYTSLLGTDISTSVKGVSSSVYLRYEVISTNDFDGLLLNMRADDGFVAYLNGIEVARENAPDEPAWNSAATAVREGASGLLARQFDLSASAGLLHRGTNLLAIQALNASAADDDFFVQPELIGIGRSVQTNLTRYFVQPTPGAINGVGDTNAGPLIVSADYLPKIPNASDPIIVTARLVRTFNAPVGMTLNYRVMFGAETNIVMKDDGLSGDGAAGDGIYGASIPGSVAVAGQMIRWYFRATDTVGNTSRWPLYRETLNSPQYLGTIVNDPRLTNPLPVLHWFIQNSSAADGITGTRASLFWDGVLYDNIFVNLHGQSSQGFPKKSYNMNFNTGFHFAWRNQETPARGVNLLTTFPDKAHVRNVLAYETFRDAGHAYHWVMPVRVQRNGTFFSDAHMVEDGDADYLARVGLNPSGALYKMYNTLDSATSNVEKKNRKFENNTDLQDLITGLARTGAARTAYVFDNVNIPALANYLAAMIVTGDVDCCHKNYYLYRDSEGTREWQMLPWDVDLSFGRVWTSTLAYYDDTMYTDTGLNVGNNNALPAALFSIPAFSQMYARRLRTLMDEQLQPPGTPAADLKYEKRIAELYNEIGPDAALDFAKWTTWGTPQTMPQAMAILTNTYLPKRRQYLYVTLRSSIPAAITNEVSLAFGAFDPNPISGTQVHEYLSLTNTNKVAIDISGWKLTSGIEHTFAPGTVIPANGLLYLSPDVNGFRQRPTAPKGGLGLFVQGNYKGQLSARGDTVILTDRTNRNVATLTYPGAPTAAQNQLRVTEILYAPPINSVGIAREDLEYVVLKNIGVTALNLKGVHFTNGVTFAFFNDFMLEASNSVYVAKNPDAFKIVYGSQLPVVGPYTGQFSNEGEPIELYDAVGESVLDFSYDNKWYPLTESRGHSLLIADEQSVYSDWGVRETWTFSAFPGGSAALAQAWANFQKTYFSDAEISAGAITTATADADGDGVSNYDEFIAGANPRDPNSSAKLSVLSVFDTSLQLQFPVVTGRYYSIWSATDPTSATWTREPNSFRATGSGTYTFQLDAPANTTKFYRLKTEL